MYIWYTVFLAGNHQIYGHIRYRYTVLANPTRELVLHKKKAFPRSSKFAHSHAHTSARTCKHTHPHAHINILFCKSVHACPHPTPPAAHATVTTATQKVR
jgi:hypothetical protein